MSKTRKYSPETMAIMQRFYFALQQCKKMKIIHSYREYCNLYNIESPHLIMQRTDPNRGYFQVGWLVGLVERYGVSSDWLLLGRGEMFNDTDKNEIVAKNNKLMLNNNKIISKKNIEYTITITD